VVSIDEPQHNLERLEARIAELGEVIVCYSGGVDSALVLAVAHRVLGPRAIGLTAVSPSLAKKDLEDAVAFARDLGVDHRLVESHEIDDPDYQKNGPDRCFHCKSELYAIAAKKRDEWSITHVANGTNVDDLGDHRPGLEAARRAGVVSPFVELGFDKAAVRGVASLLELPVWDRPASACLSSRIAYGTSVTPERLAMVGELEAKLRAIGFRQLRVRYHGLEGGKAFARIEVDPSEIVRAASSEVGNEIVRAAKALGFAYVTLDLEGYRMGSHNEVLSGRSLRVVS
jgi:uncharacterized protein